MTNMVQVCSNSPEARVSIKTLVQMRSWDLLLVERDRRLVGGLVQLRLHLVVDRCAVHPRHNIRRNLTGASG